MKPFFPSARLLAVSIALITANAGVEAQNSPGYQPPANVYLRTSPNTYIGSDGSAYFQSGNVIVEATDPGLVQNGSTYAPPGMVPTASLGTSSTVYRDQQGRTLICTPVGGKVICH